MKMKYGDAWLRVSVTGCPRSNAVCDSALCSAGFHWSHWQWSNCRLQARVRSH